MKKTDESTAPISAPTESTENFDTQSQGKIILAIIVTLTYFLKWNTLCFVPINYPNEYTSK